MGKMKRKHKESASAKYMTRAQAIRRLQLSLAAFRKMCILKGVYPRDPKKKLRGKDKTYYHTKDINFLASDPLIDTFRAMNAHRKKVTKAKAKNQTLRVKKLIRHRPTYKLDRIVRERYPTFADVLRDLDDALCMAHIFAVHPKTKRVKADKIASCERLSREFQVYVIKTGCLVKAFVSIKGIYYQAEIAGQTITWMAPHHFTQAIANNVDYRVMMTFLELYDSMLGFTLYKLYSDAGLVYPPTPSQSLLDAGDIFDAYLSEKSDEAKQSDEDDADDEEESDDSDAMEDDDDVADKTSAVKSASEQRLATLDVNAIVEPTEAGDDDDVAGPAAFARLAQDAATRAATHDMTRSGTGVLFNGLKFFLAREVPRHCVEFVVRACGGEIAHDENDADITHYVIDKDLDSAAARVGVVYVQPQWVFDSLNNNARLPVGDYAPDATLPPHLSPFVDDEAEGYVPAYRRRLNELLERAREHRAALEAAGEAALGAPLELSEAAQQLAVEAAQREQLERDGLLGDDDEPADDAAIEAQYARELEAERAGQSFSAHVQAKRAAKQKKRARDDETSSEASQDDTAGTTQHSKKRKSLLTEEEKMKTVMLPKKHQRLLRRIEYSHNKKQDKIEKLENKAKQSLKKQKKQNKEEQQAEPQLSLKAKSPAKSKSPAKKVKTPKGKSPKSKSANNSSKKQAKNSNRK